MVEWNIKQTSMGYWHGFFYDKKIVFWIRWLILNLFSIVHIKEIKAGMLYDEGWINHRIRLHE